MKSDIPAAALRLMAQCRVHTHERKPAPRETPNLGNPAPVKGRAVLFGKGGKARPVRYKGTQYDSVTGMSRKLHISTAKVYELLRAGEVEYITKGLK